VHTVLGGWPTDGEPLAVYPTRPDGVGPLGSDSGFVKMVRIARPEPPRRRLEVTMIHRPSSEWNAFEYVVISALRTHQLLRGCRPRVPASHKATATALREVAAGKVVKLVEAATVPSS